MVIFLITFVIFESLCTRAINLIGILQQLSYYDQYILVEEVLSELGVYITAVSAD